MQSNIFTLLEELGLVSESSTELFNTSTRDNSNIEVFRDTKSGVIYIKDFFVGDFEYSEGHYRLNNETDLSNSSANYEAIMDLERRLAAYRKFVFGKNLLDFGCGDGAFLKAVSKQTATSCGVELQKNYIQDLNSIGIMCVNDTKGLPDNSFDVITLFHVLEHLPDPKATLTELIRVARPNAKFIIEVPHANDFLIWQLQNQDFKQFTLWSQHLILHTRNSLLSLLSALGICSDVEGVQRYGLSNHLKWMRDGAPGGHKSDLAIIESQQLASAYQESLRKIDATDTLVAVGQLN